MTDIRDIYSTRQTTKDIEGNNVITVRDSLLAECLLSIIMGITLLSCLVVLRSYIDIIDVNDKVVQHMGQHIPGSAAFRCDIYA